MARYVAAPRRPRAVQAEDEWYSEPRETMEVIVRGAEPADSGLLDQFGVTLWRMPDRHKVGF